MKLISIMLDRGNIGSQLNYWLGGGINEQFVIIDG